MPASNWIMRNNANGVKLWIKRKRPNRIPTPKWVEFNSGIQGNNKKNNEKRPAVSFAG